MHRHVPSSPESIDVVGIPPVAIEISIREVQQLAHQIQEGVKHQIEETKPYQVIRYLKQRFIYVCKLYLV